MRIYNKLLLVRVNIKTFEYVPPSPKKKNKIKTLQQVVVSQLKKCQLEHLVVVD